MSQDQQRALLMAALEQLEETKALFEQAIELVPNDKAPAAAKPTSSKPEDITITGKVGRPKLTETSNGIALWEAGLQLTNEDGSKEWINIQAWRKTAVYAGENLPSAAIATAVGRYETEQWRDEKGDDHERRKFVVKHFLEQK